MNRVVEGPCSNVGRVTVRLRSALGEVLAAGRERRTTFYHCSIISRMRHG